MDIPWFPTYCEGQMNSSFVLNTVYTLVFPILSCSVRLHQVLIFVLLYGNLAVRRHIYIGNKLPYSDSLILFLALLAIEIVLSSSMKEFEQPKTRIPVDQNSDKLKYLEQALEMIQDGILVIENSPENFLAQNVPDNDTQSEFHIKYANGEF